MASDADSAKVCVVLLWIIWIVGIIWYFADEKMKKNKFATFWVKQWLILLIAGVAASIISGIPFLGWVLGPVAMIFLFVLWVIGLISILKNEEKPLPIIGQYALEWFKW